MTTKYPQDSQNIAVKNDTISTIDYGDTANLSQTSQVHSNRFIRWLFLFLGTLFFALGMIGVVLPVLPTTPFVLLAAACWAKGSDRFHQWLINHKVFGKMVTDWQQKRAIPRYGKYLAWTMMTASCMMLFYRLQDSSLLWLAWVTSAICLATAIWMARLPDA
ncbi:YbaN family protein [Psychrobacter sp. I-STPA6b]|uniref:YbaN family protein n=1 Tax=Psychrobacter sp. I-STPA6b TaxID=2585718 RepID=UPI002221BC98|nr:YbaN family protein [Psychrobacter sp. I-STPA6b]